MSNLAALPTRTSVAIRSDDQGSNASIAAATEQQAGVMTAEMVKALNRLRVILDQDNVITMPVRASETLTTIRPLPPIVDQAPSTPQQIQRVEELAGQVQQLAGAILELRDQWADRIAVLEQRLAVVETRPVTAEVAPPEPYGDDITALRQDLAEIANEVLRLTEIADHNEQYTNLLSEMINDPTPVREV